MYLCMNHIIWTCHDLRALSQGDRTRWQNLRVDLDVTSGGMVAGFGKKGPSVERIQKISPRYNDFGQQPSAFILPRDYHDLRDLS
jgi:hypothetical protein